MNEGIVLIGLLFGFAIVVIVIILLAVLYSERKEAASYAEESKRLIQLLTAGKIDQETYERLRTKLENEMTYRKELDALSSALLVVVK